ncbi:hypothetical protein K438DRAFT_1977958 [Mycena galopus ATCC 62051]|nr:hypothetical protein K438DRAFT_1977958 [Mycena galopus ATCC 62051]
MPSVLEVAEQAFLGAMVDVNTQVASGKPHLRIAALNHVIDLSCDLWPFTEHFHEALHAPGKEVLYRLRDSINRSVREDKFRPPEHYQNDLHQVLSRYEAECRERNAPPPARPSGTVAPSGTDTDSSGSEDGADLGADSEMKMESNTKGSRAGSGAVPGGDLPSNLHFSKSSNATEVQTGGGAVAGSTKGSKGDKAKSKELRDKDVRDQAATETDRGTKGRSTNPIILDDPIDFTVGKAPPTDEKANNAHRLRKLKPKHPLPSAPVAPAPATTDTNNRKRRRNQSGHVFDAEQEYDVPTNPTIDVSPETPSGRLFREKEVQRQISVCGYRLKHFVALHDHFTKELAEIRASVVDGNDADMEEADP